MLLTYADLESEAERLLWDGIEFGLPVDCRVCDPKRDDPADGGSWDKHRTVRAELLIQLLTVERRPSGQRPRALRLYGARIEGRLDLEAATLGCPLVLNGCHFEAPLLLTEARAPSIRLVGSSIPSISGRQLETRGDLMLDGLTAKTLDLEGARTGGVLSLRDANLRGKGKPAFDGDRLEVHQDMDCRGFTADGEVRLIGAHVSGRLSFNGATLHHPLTAYGLEVERSMLCEEGFSAQGEVRLAGAHVGGELRFNGATLHQALIADGLRVERSMLCEKGFSAAGKVSLLGAHVGGELRFNGATLHQALIAGGLRVERNMLCEKGFSAEGEVRLAGARVGGDLRFNGATLHQALIADGLRVERNMLCEKGFSAEGEVRLAGAHVGGVLSFDVSRLHRSLILAAAYVDGLLSFDGATLDEGLTADGLRVGRSIFARNGFTAGGEVSLVGAHVSSRLWFESATLQALIAEGLQVDWNMFCRNVTARGEVRLAGAHVGGQLSFNDAQLHQGLIADRLQVEQDMSCEEGFCAKGEVRLVDARVGGQLSFRGACFRNENAAALCANSLRVGGDLCCGAGDNGQPFEATGELRLRGAHVGGRLSFTGARLRNSQGLVLDLESVEARELWLPSGDPPDGTVSLSEAVVGQLHDGCRPAQADGSSHQYRLRLSGFVYHSLGQECDNCEARLAWLRYAAGGSEGYVPQAYDQLTAVFRRAGREEDAQRVAIAKQRRRRKELPLPTRVASSFLDVGVGYGYRTWRAVGALLAIVVIGAFVFHSAFPKHMRAIRPASQLPHFQAWLYSTDAVLPVINLGQKSAWTPTGAAQFWYVFSVLAGWLLGLGFVAYFTAKLFRE